MPPTKRTSGSAMAPGPGCRGDGATLRAALGPALRLLLHPARYLPDAPRTGDVVDLELARDQRAVAEEPAEERLLDLDRPRPREPHARRAPPEEPVGDVELLGRNDEARALPLPGGPHRDERGQGEDERAGDGERPADPGETGAEGAERDRLRERTSEDDAV